MTRLRAILPTLVVAGVLFWPASTGPARAQTQQPGDTSRVFLASQKSWLGPNEDIQLSVRVASSQPADSLELAITLCKAVTSRSEFVLTLQDKARCSILDFQNPPLTQLTDDGNGGLKVQIPALDHLEDPGVYPLRVELRTRAHEQLDHFITHVVVVSPAPADSRLGVAWVVPVHGPSVTTKDAPRTLLPTAADHVNATIEALAAHPFVPLTLLPTPDTLDLLASGRPADQDALGVLEREAQATATRQLVTAPYVPIDLPAMHAAGLTNEISAQVGRGGDALSTRLQARPDPRTWVADSQLDDQSVAGLSDRGVDRLVVPESTLDPLNLSRTLPTGPAGHHDGDRQRTGRPLRAHRQPGAGRPPVPCRPGRRLLRLARQQDAPRSRRRARPRVEFGPVVPQRRPRRAE